MLHERGCVVHTELDTGVVLTNLLAAVVGKEHVSRKTALGCVGVWDRLSIRHDRRRASQDKIIVPFFFLPLSALVDLRVRVVFASLGILTYNLIILGGERDALAAVRRRCAKRVIQ